MKQLGLTFLMIFVVATAFAAIEKGNFESRAISLISSARSASVSSSSQLQRVKNKLTNFVNNHGNKFDAADKTNFTNIKSKMLDAENALNLLVTEIDNAYPSINQ